jgi:hypothetical protein
MERLACRGLPGKPDGWDASASVCAVARGCRGDRMRRPARFEAGVPGTVAVTQGDWFAEVDGSTLASFDPHRCGGQHHSAGGAAGGGLVDPRRGERRDRRSRDQALCGGRRAVVRRGAGIRGADDTAPERTHVASSAVHASGDGGALAPNADRRAFAPRGQVRGPGSCAHSTGRPACAGRALCVAADGIHPWGRACRRRGHAERRGRRASAVGNARAGRILMAHAVGPVTSTTW